MKVVALFVVFAELVLCDKLQVPTYVLRLNPQRAFDKGQKYEILYSISAAHEQAGFELGLRFDALSNRLATFISADVEMERKNALGQMVKGCEKMTYPSKLNTEDLYEELKNEGVVDKETNDAVVAFWEGVRYETQFTIKMLQKLVELNPTLNSKLEILRTMATQRYVEASNQFLKTLIFGRSGEKPSDWKYTEEMFRKIVGYTFPVQKDPISLGLTTLIKTHSLAEMVSEAQIKHKSRKELLFVYALLLKVEEENRGSLNLRSSISTPRSSIYSYPGNNGASRSLVSNKMSSKGSLSSKRQGWAGVFECVKSHESAMKGNQWALIRNAFKTNTDDPSKLLENLENSFIKEPPTPTGLQLAQLHAKNRNSSTSHDRTRAYRVAS